MTDTARFYVFAAYMTGLAFVFAGVTTYWHRERLKDGKAVYWTRFWHAMIKFYLLCVLAFGLRREFGWRAHEMIYILPYILGYLAISIGAIELKRVDEPPKEGGFSCPSCGKFTSAWEEWICGYCEKSNKASAFSACHNCQQVPSAYLCPHCQFTFATPSNHTPERKFPARLAKAPRLPSVVESIQDKHKQERVEREHKLLLLRMDAELAEEQARLERIKEQAQKKPKTLEDDFASHTQSFMSVHEIVAKALKNAEEKYKDDPEMRMRYKESIEAWKSRHV